MHPAYLFPILGATSPVQRLRTTQRILLVHPFREMQVAWVNPRMAILFRFSHNMSILHIHQTSHKKSFHLLQFSLFLDVKRPKETLPNTVIIYGKGVILQSPGAGVSQLALTLAEQRELPGEEVSGSVEFLVTSPYGSRRYAHKVSAIGLKPLVALIDAEVF